MGGCRSHFSAGSMRRAQTLKDGGHVTQDTSTAKRQGKLGIKHCSGARLFGDANTNPASTRRATRPSSPYSSTLIHCGTGAAGRRNKDLIFEAIRRRTMSSVF